jgi:hypothetical protein
MTQITRRALGLDLLTSLFAGISWPKFAQARLAWPEDITFHPLHKGEQPKLQVSNKLGEKYFYPPMYNIVGRSPQAVADVLKANVERCMGISHRPTHVFAEAESLETSIKKITRWYESITRKPFYAGRYAVVVV